MGVVDYSIDDWDLADKFVVEAQLLLAVEPFDFVLEPELVVAFFSKFDIAAAVERTIVVAVYRLPVVAGM